jgi:nucleotide-binding universal stress UspA family protein
MCKILVATDGSEHSRRAVAHAARRAKSEPCKIYLLHVEKATMAREVGSVSSIEAVSAEREAKSREVLDAGVGRFDQTTEVERLAVTGEPTATMLEQAATKLATDEIIIGSRSLRPVGAARLGRLQGSARRQGPGCRRALTQA